MNQKQMTLIEKLGLEFERVALREAAAVHSRTSKARTPSTRARQAVALALAMLVFGGTAAALTDGFGIGNGTSGLEGVSNVRGQTSGTSSDGTQWQLLSGREGDVLCLSLRFPGSANTQETQTSATAQCGGFTADRFTASLAYMPGETSALLYGTLPAAAQTVRSDRDGPAAQTVPAPPGFSGKLFVLELPGEDAIATMVAPADNDGTPLAAAETVKDLLSRSSSVNR
jgi:hypothetical protein